ncbi:unnamed protein product [Brassica napus]|uniref:(rape) hypothetical protein n=1 Tax=Brassica napus TaxID=3708 RepID=A0A816K4W0_BRANA|nr:unnamed protein product [Brassica napus]
MTSSSWRLKCSTFLLVANAWKSTRAGVVGMRSLSFRSQYQSWRCSQLKFMPEKDDFSGQTCLSVAS